MTINDPVISAESKYINLLESFFIRTGSGILHSHNLGHHKRVWCHAKELLAEIKRNDGQIPEKLADTLLLGSYLHDLGMAIDAGFGHGSHSADLCRQFLDENCLNESDFPGVIRAIEEHDRKDYGIAGATNNPATLLSVADDLDAFGYIGIYRYAEIYLARGIPPEELGFRILGNSDNRFGNFSRVFTDYPELISRHEEKYLILRNFFINYNIQLAKEGFRAEDGSGYHGVICLISEMLRRKIVSDTNLFSPQYHNDDQVINDFLENLAAELNR